MKMCSLWRLSKLKNTKDDIESAVFRLAKRMRTERELKPELTEVHEVLPVEQEILLADQLMAQNKSTHTIQVHAVSKRESPFPGHFGCNIQLQMYFEVKSYCTVAELRSQIKSNREFREKFKVLYDA